MMEKPFAKQVPSNAICKRYICFLLPSAVNRNYQFHPSHLSDKHPSVPHSTAKNTITDARDTQKRLREREREGGRERERERGREGEKERERERKREREVCEEMA